MVLTKEELLAALRDEVRILLHLAGKVDPAHLDYRPTPKQRSTLELLQYMAIMGPTQTAALASGVFNRETLSAVWSPAEAASKKMTFAEALDAIRTQADSYTRVVGAWSEAEFALRWICSAGSSAAATSW